MSHLRKKADFKQRQLVNSPREQCQCKAYPQKSQAEIEALWTLYETLPCIYFTLNSRGVILSVSQFGAAYLGYEAIELVQTSLDQLLDGEEQRNSQIQLTNIQKKLTEINHWETCLLHKNGTLLWVRAIARLVPGTGSNPQISLVCEDITASKQVEERLRASEELHRNTLTSISDTVLITTDNGTFTYICPNVQVIFGYSEQEVRQLGKITNLLGEFIVDRHELEKSGELHNIQWEIADKTGKEHTLLINVKRVSIKEGTILYSCRDITQRKQAEDELSHYRLNLERRVTERTSELIRLNQKLQQEIAERKLSAEKLRQSEDNYRTLAKNIPNSTAYLFDRDLRLLVAEGAEMQGEGLTKSHFEGKTLPEALNPEVCGLLEPYYLQALTGKAATREFSYGDRYYILQIAPLFNEGGEVYGGVALTQNITERKQYEQALQASEARFRQIINSNLIGFFFSDYSGLITEANPAFLTLVGYTRSEMLGGHLRRDTLTPPEYQLLDERAMDEIKLSGACTPYEKEFIRKDGSRVPIILAGACFEDERDTGRGFAFVLDLTEQKQAEAVLQTQFLKEQLLGAIAQRIHQSLNLDEILNTTVAEVRHVLNCDRVIIFHLHDDGSGMVVVESVDSDWMPISGVTINDRYFAEDYIHLYQQGRVQAVEDIYTAGLTPCHIELLVQFQVRANLVVPIVQEEKLWGLLVAQQCCEPRQWQGWEIDLLKSLATHTAIAIHQSELYQQAQTEIAQRQQAEAALRQQFQREQLVGAITQRIRQSLKLEEILERTVAEVRQVLQTDRVIIFRFEPDWSGNVVVESVDERCSPILGENIYDPCFRATYISQYKEGRVRTIDDIYTANLSECHVNLLSQFNVRANLVVPILQSEQTIANGTPSGTPVSTNLPSLLKKETKSATRLWGLLIAHHCHEPKHWQQCEIDLLGSLASQVAIAIQQSQLYEQAKSLFLGEQALNQVTQAIRSSLDLETIFATAVREIGELLQVDRAQIVQYLPERNGWLHVSEYRKSDDSPGFLGRKIPDENNPIAEQLKRLEVVRINDTNRFEDPIHKSLAQHFPGAWLLVPLHFGSCILGSLMLGRNVESYHWQDSEVELIRGVADQVAIAIQQSQLYRQAQYHFLREQAINHLTQAIRRSLDLQTIFSTATQEIENLLQVDRAQIVQYLPERKLWVNVAESCKGQGLSMGVGLEIPDEHNPITEKLKRLEVVRIDDTNIFEDEANQAIAQKLPGAWLLVPLHCGSSVWGALGLVVDAQPYHWQDIEVELICGVADQLAIALQQAELYKQSRTAEAKALKQAQELEQALEQLRRTQAQLVQSEKMSSLGQLVAGVAHEINNPVNFIYGNLMHAREYAQDLLGLLQLYQQQYPKPTPEIQSEIEAIDLEFLIEDLPKLLESMKVGAERIAEIVYSLRNFSRVAEAEMKAVNIHEGLDSTLMILQNRLKARGEHPGIQIIKDYGDLPQVECYAGQLNQVFMNLFINAIDAIDEQNRMRSLATVQTNPGQIRVQTKVVNDREITIQIVDNGPGMSEQVQQQLFDPFFTTKPVGTGTGLGLSISYQIVVEKHGGQLYFQSKAGQGTEFVIQIPLRQDNCKTSDK
ncbi:MULTISPECIES: GAF domain-containing protein [unclassified Coleofasciculus]|uniref:GAF domain-containing protein n=1 Tax=unclassified Coleofasciculus TaxID=2692782 RepID=UPI00187EB9B2|nr:MULTISPECIES: GAF domain-containing protein [unclassified Coleofasciculus]MBE9129540.1 GAF domain-containing protein [Coleofasciculus sp. LEGE 07081]MBE9150053.1 GAF domain-containing protein [Coleofasciculus sp. LEGE 07092]